MSRWRQKGFVQDSDEDEDDSQLDSEALEQVAAADRRVEGVKKDGTVEETTEQGNDRTQEDEGHVVGFPSESHTCETATNTQCVATTPAKRTSSRRPTLSPFPPGPACTLTREPTESPDPLQSTPSPLRRQRRPLQPNGPQRASSPILSRNLGLPTKIDLSGTATSTSPGKGRANGGGGAPSILGIFGIAPLSDDSDDEELSEPPSDLELSPPAYTEPHRRTTAQILIPSSTLLQKRIDEQRSRREFRQRKPIQLHPYALEGELYRREVQSRGLKPVARERSPHRDQRRQDDETQEREFDPNASPSSSPPEAEIPFSAPVLCHPRDTSKEFVKRLPSNQLHHPRTVKRRKLNVPLSETDVALRPDPGARDLPCDIWSIPPNSPPLSSSPPLASAHSVGRNARLLITTPAPNLPTPATSSVFQDDNRIPAPESDHESIPPSRRNTSSILRRPSRIVAVDSSSSEPESSSETEQVDQELRQVGRKIKGVLPASWLRIDQEAQKRRQKRLHELEIERARLETLQAPASTEPQRGVAKRVVKRTGRTHDTSAWAEFDNVVTISDDSDTELRPLALHHDQDARYSMEDAATLAAALDDRYAGFDTSDMEDDRLHLPTLGNAGTRQRRQVKLTEVFEKAKRSKPNGAIGERVTDGKAYSTSSKKKAQHRSKGRGHVNSPPSLSVIDLNVLPTSQRNDLPHFLRLARRLALRRPDLARQSPRCKSIRLHTAEDTKDANLTLQQWRQGNLKPKGNTISQARHTRQPLVDKPDNMRGPLLDEAHNDDGKVASVSKTSNPRSGTPVWPMQKSLPPGLQVFRRTSSSMTRSCKRGIKSTLPVRKSGSRIRKEPLPVRSAQLEGEEKDFGHVHRRIAFEQGLRRADNQPEIALTRVTSHLNPLLARFLAADDNDAMLPPLPSAKDIGEKHEEIGVKAIVPTKERRHRKKSPQRIDISAREYRQPSEPAAQEVLIEVNKAVSSLNHDDLEQPIICGLGPHGTRYPISFDVYPLSSETYFHSNTFVGSDELREALQFGQASSRELEKPAGYYNFLFRSSSFRCGPWNDETYSILQNESSLLVDRLAEAMAGVAPSPDTVEEHLSGIAHFVRAMVAYISKYLSFTDPIDRKDFVARMVHLGNEVFNRVSAVSRDLIVKQSAKSSSRMHMRAMTFLLVMGVQLLHIAQHRTVDTIAIASSQIFIKTVSSVVVVELAQSGVAELGYFLERNNHQKVREAGVQADDIIVESTIVCMHSLSSARLPTCGFWDLLSQALCPRVANATLLSTFESTWATIFTFLPFSEVDITGIATPPKQGTLRSECWICIRDLLKRIFELYPSTQRRYSTSLNAYVRANLARCHRLLKQWHWGGPELVLHVIFDFFSKNGLKQLRREAHTGSATFLQDVASPGSLNVDVEESSFHIALKVLALGLMKMKSTTPEKRIRSFVFRTIPNHGRAYPKDQSLDEETLTALRNHHDLLSTLYRGAPPPCRPRLDQIRNLVDHEASHREACRISVRSWANLATFQVHTGEPYVSAEPFALWYKDIMHQTLKQYRLAKIEAEDYLQSGILDGSSDVSMIMVRQTMERNQEQVIATLRESVAGMQKVLQHAKDPNLLRDFLVSSDIVSLLELPHFEDRRLVSVIRDVLMLLRDYVGLQDGLDEVNISQQPTEDSQDYGDFPDVDDFEADASTFAMDILGTSVQQSNIDLVQQPLWRLLSNAFGAETPPDDNLLMDCIDTWVCIANRQITLGHKSWSYYLDSYSQVSWKQLRQTEHTRKFGPYFLAAVIGRSKAAYREQKQDFIQALLSSLAERDSMLRFQYRLLHAIVTTDADHPLMRNLPFFCTKEGSKWDITAETLRTRRLALISTFLSNMRDEVHKKYEQGLSSLAEARRDYAVMLKDFMAAMKHNYQLLQQGSTVTGAYVEFVQRIVQFLKQYTNDICPVMSFFTDSVGFPLPAGDPTYVVGRLCGYASKARDSGTSKQLSVFMQTVVQQAAIDNQHSYLVEQLITSLCTNEAPTADRIALRSVLLSGIFPAYIEDAFTSLTAFVIAGPILQALPVILEATIFDLRVTQHDRLASIVDPTLSVAHAFIRATEQLKHNLHMLKQSHVLSALSLMLGAVGSLLPLLVYVCERKWSFVHLRDLAIMVYVQEMTVFIAEILHNIPQHSIPSYLGDANTPPRKEHSDLLAFCKRELEEALKANWSQGHDTVWFGAGHNKREIFTAINSAEEERARLLQTIVTFQQTLDRICSVEGAVAIDEGYPRDDVVV
ncbi:hypothetical protein ACN47E_005861 [Coniothyrium glycines]